MTDPNSSKAEFLSIFNKISHLSKEDILFGAGEEYKSELELLQGFARRKVDENALAQKSQTDPDLVMRMRKVTEIMYFANLRNEMNVANRIANSSDPFGILSSLSYYEAYKSTVATEFEGSNLRPGDRVLFLGSGPLPISLIIFCQLFEIGGLGVEREHRFCELANHVLESLRLTGKIGIQNGDHFSLPPAREFQHLFIALDAEPKTEILNQMERVLPSGMQFSLRVNPATNVISNDIKRQYLSSPHFQMRSQAAPIAPGVNSVVFLVKT